MRHPHRTNLVGRALLGASLGASVLLSGCAADVAGSDPVPAPAVATEASAQTASTAKVTPESSHPDHCSPLACCFPSSGGGWQDNPLENQLQAIGCTAPSPYQQTASAFWVWTRCPFDFKTLEVVYEFRGTPYDARFIENACLGFDPGTVVVEFDPTCGTCRQE